MNGSILNGKIRDILMIVIMLVVIVAVCVPVIASVAG